MSKSQDGNERNEDMVSYVDTLLDLELPEEKRKLDDSEMVGEAGPIVGEVDPMEGEAGSLASIRRAFLSILPLAVVGNSSSK